MDTFEKLALIKHEMDVEVDDSIPGFPAGKKASFGGRDCEDPSEGLPISMVCLPNGKRMPVLKSLLTSACERNCNYCAFRAGRDFRRVTFQPEEMAQAVDRLTKKKVVDGVFLSSGVAAGGVRTEDRLIATIEYLRRKLNYQGYVHLKLMPGTEFAQVERAMQLADRVSVNLEGPNTNRLQALAPQKVFMEELLQPLRWVEKIRRERPGHEGWKGRWPSTTTQFVVGAVGESDLELLQTLAWLNQNVRLARGYFSGFSPTPDTPFEDRNACNPWREHRLYQASFLLRDYGFDLEELPFAGEGNLPIDVDPKMAWAKANLSEMPMEINKADRRDLLRIPGVGPVGAKAIMDARRKNNLRSVEDLKNLGVPIGRAGPFILLDGQRPAVQLGLWN